MGRSRIVVEVEEFVLASRVTYEDVARPLGSAVDAVGAMLDGCAGMAGNDSVGGDFALAYDRAAHAAVAASAVTANACARIAAMFAQSGRNYAAADVASDAAQRAATAARTATLPPPLAVATPVVPTARRASDVAVPVLPGGGTGLARALFDAVPNGSPEALHTASAAWRSLATEFDGSVFTMAMTPTRFDQLLLPEAEDITAVCHGIVERLRVLGTVCDLIAAACSDFAAALADVQSELASQARHVVLSNAGGVSDAVRLVHAYEEYRARATAATASLERVLGPCAELAAALHSLSIAPLVEAGLAQVPSLPGAVPSPPDLAPTARLANGYPVTVIDPTTAVSLTAVPPNIRPYVLATLARARTLTLANQGHDNKPFENRERQLPSGVSYTKWTVSAPNAKRGRLRLIIAGDPRRPTAIYYSDHYDSYIWIGP